MRKRLYLQLYAMLIGVSILSLVTAALAFRLINPQGEPQRRVMRIASQMMSRLVTDQPLPLRERIMAAATDFDLDILVVNRRGEKLVEFATRPFPPVDELRPGFTHDRSGPGFVARLQNGLLVAVRERGGWHPRALSFFALLAIVGAVMAAGTYPMARRITRRLEALDRGVRRFGAGDLSHRVAEMGSDEVASVAASFNRAAGQIETLVLQQKQLLANASHELRSPLTRIRMALELVGEEPDPARREKLIRGANLDIMDLDKLVEDLLLSARADIRVPDRPLHPVDFSTLVIEEAARVEANVSGVTPGIQLLGDATLLRHMVRNLFENAHKHAGPEHIEAELAREGDALVFRVCDRGPGVPESERERIFAPFFRLNATHPDGKHPSGSGLGLSLVRQVAHFHRGTVRCLPRDGGGAVFAVTLPQ